MLTFRDEAEGAGFAGRFTAERRAHKLEESIVDSDLGGSHLV
jgi:hypothetical protein